MSVLLHPLAPYQPPLPDADASDAEWFRWYDSQEADVGQGIEQSELIRVLVAVLSWWASEQGWSEVLVGSDCFFAWDRRQPQHFVSPDVFLLPSAPNPLPSSIQTWRPNHRPPLIAFEFVSKDWEKDYHVAPESYDALGVHELVIFDPHPARQLDIPALGYAPNAGRYALQLFTRDANGRLTRTYAGDQNVWSEVLGAWLTIVPTDMGPRLRIATDPQGRQLVPTGHEAGMAFRHFAEAEQERAEAERERAEAERERAEAEREKAEIERARAELAEVELEQERRRAEAAEAERATLLQELAQLRAQLGRDIKG